LNYKEEKMKCDLCGNDVELYYEENGKILCMACYDNSNKDKKNQFDDLDNDKAADNQKSKMENEVDTRLVGIISLAMGIIAIIMLFLGRTALFGIIFGIIAFILGRKPKKQGNKYGLYGWTLGLICIIFGIIFLIITAFLIIELS